MSHSSSFLKPTSPARTARRRTVGRSALACLGVAALVCGLAISPANAAEYDPNDYPTSADVEAAKASEAATATEIDRITTLLNGLTAEAARLGDEAVQRGLDAQLAQQALDQAGLKVAALEARADSASTEASAAKKQAGQIAAQLYRSGGGDLSASLVLSNGAESSQLLYRLGTMSQITLQASRLRENAEAKQNIATSLGEQAQVARDERVGLATAAEDAFDAATAAQQAADAQVAEQQEHSDTLYTQLASLKNSTAEVEKDYADGQAAKAAYEEQQRAAEENARRAAEEANQGGGSGGGNSGGSVTVPIATGGGMSPAEAQAYASSILGNYGWGGDQYSCLVSLWNGESNWRWSANNPSSGAYGIPQSWPGSKMASVAPDWQTNAATQIIWGLGYIKAAYGSPCNAWSKWQSRSPHWY